MRTSIDWARTRRVALTPPGVDELMSKTSLMPPWTGCGTTPALVLTAGDGIRLTEATAAKGVTPLTN